MENKPALSVVVCTYKRPELLQMCLDALSKQTLSMSEFEVIVIDNDPGQSAQSISCSCINGNLPVRYLCEKRVGVSFARDCGWKNARAEYVAFIDDDALASCDWCENILAAFRDIKPVPTAVGGPIYPWVTSPLPTWFDEDLEVRSWGDRAHYLVPPRAKIGFSGSNMAFPKKVLELYGGFNPAFGMSGGDIRMGEDTELFFRLFSHSPLFWYDPDIVVKHHVSGTVLTLKGRFQRWYQNGYCRGRLENQLWRPLNIFRHLCKVVVFALLLTPFRLIFRSPHKTECIRVLQDLAFLSGRAAGVMRR